MSTWFNPVLRETRQGDIFDDESATATVDSVESLYPRLPSEDCTEIELNITEAGGGGTSQSQSFRS